MKLEAAARGKRYDHAIHEALEAGGRATSVREVREALKDGRIRVDGRIRKPGDRAEGGEAIVLEAFVPRLEAVVEAEPDLLARAPVRFEDAHLLALDKPSGMPTAPIRAGERATLLGAAIAVAPSIASAGPPLEGGLCHRLDVDTSGLVLFAKDAATRDRIRGHFGAHAIEKRYLALVSDPTRVLEKGMVIDGAILGAGDHVRVVDPNTGGEALEASTRILSVEPLQGARRFIEVSTHTGRRHQIRAHLASKGAPIAGDNLYGGELGLVPRLALHAHLLLLPDGPKIDSPLPEELKAVQERLR